MKHIPKHAIFSKLLTLVVLALWSVGCKGEEPPFEGVYSIPAEGRSLDFGPEGLYAELLDSQVVAGIWSKDGDKLKTVTISHPRNGEVFEARIGRTDEGIRLYTDDNEYYTALLSEPKGPNPNVALTGLWKNTSKEQTDVFEFTPWGTVIWIRLARHLEDKILVGASGRFDTPYPGVLSVGSVRELDYTLERHNEFGLELEPDKMIVTNRELRIRWELQRMERSELDSLFSGNASKDS